MASSDMEQITAVKVVNVASKLGVKAADMVELVAVEISAGGMLEGVVTAVDVSATDMVGGYEH